MQELLIEIQDKIKALDQKLSEVGGYLKVEALEKEMDEINEKMTASDFWDDQESAQKTVARMKVIKGLVEPWKEAKQSATDLSELCEMIEEGDDASLEDIKKETDALEKIVADLEFQRLLSDSADSENAIVNINSGAGGTESCDWAGMLYRMYVHWAEKNGFKVELIDVLKGEEAGLKSATFMIQGPYAYGYLKAESGVHRLVRISPFDSASRRHTSFASVDVVADIDDAPEIEIKDSDLRIDTYRAGGAGGQHVNKTASAVRLTHLETGIVVQCQNERSQGQNKNIAMKVLKARLYEEYRRKKEAEQNSQYDEKKKIEWGSQIRSYVFHPYNMVKDLRTQVETSNTGAVMDGEIDDFIKGYLKWRANAE